MKGKYYVGFSLLLLGALLQVTSLQAQNLYVKKKDATWQSHALSNIRKMTFKDRVLRIDRTEAATLNCPLGELGFLSFVNFASLTSLQRLKADADVSIFPNPASGYFFVHLKNFTPERIWAYRLYDASGSLLQHAIFSASTTKIDVRNLPASLLFLHLTCDGVSLSMSKILNVK